MPGELGIGVRVYIGVGETGREGDFAGFPSGHTGVIEGGPVPAGFVFSPRERPGIARTKISGWMVHIPDDPDPDPWLIGEDRLFPIDDDDDQVTRDERKPAEETV